MVLQVEPSTYFTHTFLYFFFGERKIIRIFAASIVGTILVEIY